MTKYRFPLNLQLFADGEEAASGVDDVSAAGTQEEVSTAGEQDAGQGADKAFAKRLAAERAKIENEYAERFKDYDTHKQVSDYFAQLNGMDALTLRERVELERLQEQADQQQVPVEVMRRLQELEAKAAQADELTQQQQRGQMERTYWDGVNAFAAEKGVDAKALNQFLVDSGIPIDPGNMQKALDIAFKAVRHDQLEKQIADAEKNGMKKLLGAKGSIPTVTGSMAQGQAASTAPKTFAEARARAMQRMSTTD
ncbi:hypothetical protein GXP70_18120 [Paenibacillus lycopersici]|uniref:Scaffolding protein n=1 Tax=Paenibacillus lycopersici TaxID=2704462 RepID=A0A6C0G209_9BACL|nr:hypothetical protein [Paenibacillus lycopersici]QHT61701.1 hypothetical protein GXP70_18120 [Paenibacillus lycopersici]